MNIAHITQRLAGCHMTSCDSHNGKPCDCGVIHPGSTNLELNRKIDASIAAVEELLRLKRDRRQVAQEHSPERRAGFDRRARTEPTKE